MSFAFFFGFNSKKSAKNDAKIREKMLVDLQRITATVNTVEQRRLLMDLDISMRSSGRFHSTLYCIVFTNYIWIKLCTLHILLSIYYLMETLYLMFYKKAVLKVSAADQFEKNLLKAYFCALNA